ncbi:hypothetical protein Tco_1282652 [Tanacetum coccineum]
MERVAAAVLRDSQREDPHIETDSLLDIERRIMTALELVNREDGSFAVRVRLMVLRQREVLLRAREYSSRQDLARSEAHCRALEARGYNIRTDERRRGQRQAAE